MHFENVQFPPFVISALYKNALVILDNVQQTPSEKNASMPESTLPIAKKEAAEPLKTNEKLIEHAPIKYLGKFEKRISIVVAEHAHPHIAEEDLAFLNKLLIACKLSLQDVAVINIMSNLQAEQLWQLMPAKAMLLFGVDPSSVGLPLNCESFEVKAWAGAQFMSAPALEKFRLGNDQEIKMLKSKLWTGLQKVFLEK